MVDELLLLNFLVIRNDDLNEWLAERLNTEGSLGDLARNCL